MWVDHYHEPVDVSVCQGRLCVLNRSKIHSGPDLTSRFAHAWENAASGTGILEVVCICFVFRFAEIVLLGKSPPLSPLLTVILY